MKGRKKLSLWNIFLGVLTFRVFKCTLS